MDPNGFAGEILYIDLTSGEIKREPINPQWVERFVGGWGINMKLAYDLIRPETDSGRSRININHRLNDDE